MLGVSIVLQVRKNAKAFSTLAYCRMTLANCFLNCPQVACRLLQAHPQKLPLLPEFVVQVELLDRG